MPCFGYFGSDDARRRAKAVIVRAKLKKLGIVERSSKWDMLWSRWMR